MIKPEEMLVYFYYRCSSCGEIGDEVRLEGHSGVHACMICGNVELVEPIESVEIKYGEVQKQEPKPKVKRTDSKNVSLAINALITLGYDKKVVTDTVNDLYRADSSQTKQELFKNAMVTL